MESPRHPFLLVRVDQGRSASEASLYTRTSAITRTMSHIVATEISQAKSVDWRGGGIR
jgi:hypothetical protein